MLARVKVVTWLCRNTHRVTLCVMQQRV